MSQFVRAQRNWANSCPSQLMIRNCRLDLKTKHHQAAAILAACLYPYCWRKGEGKKAERWERVGKEGQGKWEEMGREVRIKWEGRKWNEGNWRDRNGRKERKGKGNGREGIQWKVISPWPAYTVTHVEWKRKKMLKDRPKPWYWPNLTVSGSSEPTHPPIWAKFCTREWTSVVFCRA